MRVASGLEVLTGLGLVVAPSVLARLLFGSDLNGAGEATGRIAGLVMLCLAIGCWPADAESHKALIPLVAASWLAAAFLIECGSEQARVSPQPLDFLAIGGPRGVHRNSASVRIWPSCILSSAVRLQTCLRLQFDNSQHKRSCST
jgi:hypothetical protein